jgi:hypothetical protein
LPPQNDKYRGGIVAALVRNRKEEIISLLSHQWLLAPIWRYKPDDNLVSWYMDGNQLTPDSFRLLGRQEQGTEKNNKAGKFHVAD